MKRLFAAIWTILAMLLAILLLADYSNNKMIDKFQHGIYEQNSLGFLGFIEPYVNTYNKGNIYYALVQYELAEQQFAEVYNGRELEDPQDCRMRVNYALSLVEQINPNAITEENYQEVLEILDHARDILCENGCASREDNSGHYPDAQTLKNEIDEFEQQILDQFEPEEPSPTPEPSETPTPTPDGETPTPTPDGETPTPTPEGGDTPTPTPDGGADTPTPTPGSGEEPTPTPDGGGDGGATPTPTLTPEEQIIEIQGEAQQERYGGANGTPDGSSGGGGSMVPW